MKTSVLPIALALSCSAAAPVPKPRVLVGPATPVVERPQDDPPEVARRRTPLVGVVERARPAVVSIDCNVQGNRWGVFSRKASGSGVVIFDDGVIVTNFHVVAPNGRPADEISVRFDVDDDSTVYRGRVISAVPNEDLALVKIDGDAPFPTVRMSDDPPMLGETVIAIGNALGQTHTVSTGIISGLHRDLQVRSDLHFKSLLQTDAAINPGNSGGPLLDINGDLIGINVAITKEAENIGFAIPVSRVRTVLSKDLLDPSQARAYLGYEINEGTFEITSVTGGGPAELAGLRKDDRIASIDGTKIDGLDTYSIERLSIQLGRRIPFTVERDGRDVEIQLEPWDIIQGIIHRMLGVTVREVPIGRRRTSYLELTSVDPRGPAGRIGLTRGDVIAAVQPASFSRARRLQTSEDLALIIHRMKSESPLDIEVWRDDDGDGQLERSDKVSELYSGTLRVR